MRRLLDVFLALGIEHWRTAVPHLQGQFLHQIFEVLQHHVFDYFEVHFRIYVILSLHHEKLDMNPHVDRVQLDHHGFVLLEVVSDLAYAEGRQAFTVFHPKLVYRIF